MTLKNCINCKTAKDISEFHKNKASLDEHKNTCKSCCKIKIASYRHTINGVITAIYNHQVGNSKTRGHELPTYNKQEFSKWILSQVSFDALFKDWVDSDYDELLKPSIDRLDDYKGYSLDNIQLTTWNENNERGYSDRKNGDNNKLSKAVTQMTCEGLIVSEHHSSRHASRETGISQSNISRCCTGRQKTAGGFVWYH